MDAATLPCTWEGRDCPHVRAMKAKGRKITATEDETPERPSGENVVDLMAALKESLEGGGRKKAPAKKSTPAKSSTSRKKAS